MAIHGRESGEGHEGCCAHRETLQAWKHMTACYVSDADYRKYWKDETKEFTRVDYLYLVRRLELPRPSEGDKSSNENAAVRRITGPR